MLKRSLHKAREFLELSSDPLSAFVNIARRRGDVAVLAVPGPRVVQFTHPDHINALFKMRYRDRLGTESLRDLLGAGLITNAGEGFKVRRQLVGRPLTKKAIATYVDGMRELTERWAKSLLPRGPEKSREVTSGLFALSLDILVLTMFGAQIKLDRPAFAAHLDTYMYEFYMDNTRWRRVLPASIKTRGRIRRSRAVEGMQGIVRQSIETRREAGPGNDLLYVLLSTRDENGQYLDDSDLLDEVLTMLIPGHETPALMLGYALWLIANHRDVQARLHEEVSSYGPPTAESLTSCHYLAAVVDETFRLYPPAYVMGRDAREDVEIGGVQIRAGDQLITPQWVVHRDRRWWKHPEQFRPERWLNGETKDLPPGTFFPFGGGQRSCLGGHFSRMMGQVVLAELVRHLDLARDATYALEFMQGVTLRPKRGIRVQVHAREVASVTKGEPAMREQEALRA